MDKDARIRVDVPLNTPMQEIEDEVLRQAIALCDGNYHRAARRLDIGYGKVRRTLKRLGRLANASTAVNGSGVGAILLPGGREKL